MGFIKTNNKTYTLNDKINDINRYFELKLGKVLRAKSNVSIPSNSTLDIRKDSRLSGLLKFYRKLPEPMFSVWDPEVTPLRKHHPEEDPETPRDERERWNVIQSAGVTDSVEGFKNILSGFENTCEG